MKVDAPEFGVQIIEWVRGTLNVFNQSNQDRVMGWVGDQMDSVEGDCSRDGVLPTSNFVNSDVLHNEFQAGGICNYKPDAVG